MTAPCEGRGELFASGHLADHRQARAICDTCPAAQFAACAKIRDGLLADNEMIEGTWAGKFYGGVKRFRVGAA